MKKAILSIIIISTICSISACLGADNHKINQPINTTRVVMHEVLSGNPAGSVVYRLDVLLKKGDIIRSMARAYSVDAFDEAQIFFIDDAPQANWEHPCRYVLVEPKTGAYKIIESRAPPDELDRYTRIYPEK